jgi:hypothetical protein
MWINSELYIVTVPRSAPNVTGWEKCAVWPGLKPGTFGISICGSTDRHIRPLTHLLPYVYINQCKWEKGIWKREKTYILHILTYFTCALSSLAQAFIITNQHPTVWSSLFYNFDFHVTNYRLKPIIQFRRHLSKILYWIFQLSLDKI